MRKKLIFISVLVLILITVFSLGSSSKKETVSHISVTQVAKGSVSYKGENGQNAFALLKEKYQISQDASELVISIGGRKADSQKHEYWAFYVNGKLASVGPKQYITKNSDFIEWKIEKY